ncbi:hypothetical protein D3C84_669290 [compost metagenome]
MVVGEAGWPWVRDSIGTSAKRIASSRMALAVWRISGSITSSRPSRSIRAWDRLLMSSLVQAKWMNSLTLSSSGSLAACSLSRYSTALTSWLVVRSISFTRSACSRAKLSASWLSTSWASAEKAGTSPMPSWAARRCNQRTSTRTRKRIRPYSLKIGRRAPVLPA